jgi:hypothetical protein
MKLGRILLSIVLFVICMQNLCFAKNNAKVKIHKNKTPVAEGYIFSNKPGKKKSALSSKVKVIFSGFYSGSKEDRKYIEHLSPTEYSGYGESFKDSAKKESPKDHSIAWIKKDGEVYHDHLQPECASVAQKIWINEDKQLAGLTPCRKCFIISNSAPSFIEEECGGLDMASASALLDNAGFIEWAKEHLPVKEPSFLTNSKLLVFSKDEMSDKGLNQLAKEVARAYRRHTWKVIEVMAKNAKGNSAHASSF